MGRGLSVPSISVCPKPYQLAPTPYFEQLSEDIIVEGWGHVTYEIWNQMSRRKFLTPGHKPDTFSRVWGGREILVG